VEKKKISKRCELQLRPLVSVEASVNDRRKKKFFDTGRQSFRYLISVQKMFVDALKMRTEINRNKPIGIIGRSKVVVKAKKISSMPPNIFAKKRNRPPFLKLSCICHAWTCI